MPGLEILQWHALQRRQNTPVHLILFVTDHCNAKCGTCFYWQNLNHGESLAREHIENISKGMGKLLWLDISGGEPFLRKDLAWICHKFIDDNGARFLNIPTNAIQTDVVARITGEILAPGRDFRLNIAVSLDGIGENYDRVRGVPGNYKRAVATIERLMEMRASDPRLALSVVTTVMRDNIEDVKRLLALGVTEWKLDYHSLNVLRGTPMDPSLAPPSPQQFEEVAKIQLDYCRRYFNSRFGVLGGWMASAGRSILNRYYLRELEGHPKDISCNAGKVSCVIDANGDVYFCELLKKVGNLKDYNWNFEKLWYDFEASALRQQVRNCHCTHECFQTKNLIFSPLRLL
jgi:MoaA/NifB/PqqE/SkfB family radical SAM enzyme